MGLSLLNPFVLYVLLKEQKYRYLQVSSFHQMTFAFFRTSPWIEFCFDAFISAKISKVAFAKCWVALDVIYKQVLITNKYVFKGGLRSKCTIDWTRAYILNQSKIERKKTRKDKYRLTYSLYGTIQIKYNVTTRVVLYRETSSNWVSLPHRCFCKEPL